MCPHSMHVEGSEEVGGEGGSCMYSDTDVINTQTNSLTQYSISSAFFGQTVSLIRNSPRGMSQSDGKDRQSDSSPLSQKQSYTHLYRIYLCLTFAHVTIHVSIFPRWLMVSWLFSFSAHPLRLQTSFIDRNSFSKLQPHLGINMHHHLEIVC